MRFIGIIPARYASTRFPGKALVNIGGKPMIRRVYEQSSLVLDNVVVATDDSRIEEAVLSFGGKVVMTSKKHKSGTDRCFEAIEKIRDISGVQYDVIINIQGDEPFLHPNQLKIIISCFDKKNTQIATLVKPIINTEDIFNTNRPKVVINSKKEAVYFSRSPIPFIIKEKDNNWVKKHKFYKHIGLYAFKYDILKKITALPPSSLEMAESLEQLRWIENGFRIKVEFTEYDSICIDTKSDLKKISQIGLM